MRRGNLDDDIEKVFYISQIKRTFMAGSRNTLRRRAAVFGCAMTFVGFATTLIIPIVFGKLSPNAISIAGSMVILMSCCRCFLCSAYIQILVRFRCICA